MDTLAHYREIIRQVLTDYARIPYSYGEIEAHTVFDDEFDRYLLMIVGRQGTKRIHGCLIHIEIINGKVWIQRDGTEDGIANELLCRGIPRERIVLGFQSPELRRYSEFAVA